MRTDYSAPQFQAAHIRPGVWKAVHSKVKKRGIWQHNVPASGKNDKRITLLQAVRESLGSDDWFMDYMFELKNRIGYDPDHFASYEQRSTKDVLEFIRTL